MNKNILPLLLLAASLSVSLSNCKNSLATGDGSDSTYTVAYSGNGSTSGSAPKDSYAYGKGETVTVKANSGNLARTGYAFAGWNTAADGSGTTRLPATTFLMGSADVTFYAKWTSSAAASYTVTYNGNGNASGSAPADSSTYVASAVVTVLANTGNLTKPGYAFAGWNTAADGSGTTYAAGQTFAMGSANATLYAKWGDEAVWAQSVSGGSNLSVFDSIAADGSGNVYAAGYQNGTGTYTYGSRNVTGPYVGYNSVLVKYDSTGAVQWAQTVTTGPYWSQFSAAAVDGSGNVYAAGWQTTSGIFNYGGQDVAGAYASSDNAVLVKYDSSGTGLWARSVSTGPDISRFHALAVDGSGNVYAAGMQTGTGTYTYSGGPSATAASGYSGSNVLLVKYNSSGTAIWAKTITTGTNESCFVSVAVDGSGNVYAAGWQKGTGIFTYDGLDATASSGASGYNVVLVKYDSSGNAQWAQSVSAGSSWSQFDSVAVDASGNVYTAGWQLGTGAYTYGGQSVAGAYATSDNAVLVKYNSSGAGLWAKSVSLGPDISRFHALAVDGSGNIYAAGSLRGTGTFTYGDQSAAGTYAGGYNIALVKYDSSGTAIWARSLTAGSSDSLFDTVSVDGSGNVYAAGYQTGTGTYTYGGQSAAGGYSSGTNAVIVKWRP